jgi:hypothetical protein
MARKTEEAVGLFSAASGLGALANARIVLIDRIDSNLEEINSRCMLLGGSLSAMGEGLQSLAEAIRDVYDKLEQIDRKIS